MHDHDTALQGQLYFHARSAQSVIFILTNLKSQISAKFLFCFIVIDQNEKLLYNGLNTLVATA
jgi:hypothetical protein